MSNTNDTKATVLEGEVLEADKAARPWKYKPDTPPERLRGGSGRFVKGNPWAFQPGCAPGPGRTPGLRNKVNADFLQALSDDFAQHGIRAIQRMRNSKPHVYVQVVASLLPKQLQIEEKPLDGLGDADLAAILSSARAALIALADPGEGEGAADLDQPLALLPALPEAT